MKRATLLASIALAIACPGIHADEKGKKDGLPNPFFAMDTGFRRPGLTTEQQLDVVKELGFQGIAWTEQPAAEVRKVAGQAKSRGLRVHAIYCGAKIDVRGELTHSADLLPIMDALQAHETVIWLYLTGPGPKLDGLTEKGPVIRKLREVADAAGERKLRIAVYPHSGFWIANTSQAIRLASLVDRKNFGVSFNLIHSVWAGEEKEIPKLLEKAGPLLFCVTVNGADRTARPGFRTGILTLDQGSYDLTPVLRKLHQIGYRGPIGFQGYGIKGDTRSILKPTMRAWRKLSRAAVE